MRLSTPYILPFRVSYQPEVAWDEHDITLRIFPADNVSTEAADAMDSTVLPFLLMGASGALAGVSIEPWESTVNEWSSPVVRDSAIEWSLKSVRFDPQAWVMLAQMLMVDHRAHAIGRIEIVDPRSTEKTIEVVTGASRVNPYPDRWPGIDFAVELGKDISKNLTVCVAFAREPSDEEQAIVSNELFAWAPGLMFGAYGVAPVPPDRCTGMPDEELVFVDNELEWAISNFKAHTSAIDGLVNVFASLSKKVVPVQAFRIE